MKQFALFLHISFYMNTLVTWQIACYLKELREHGGCGKRQLDARYRAHARTYLVCVHLSSKNCVRAHIFPEGPPLPALSDQADQ